MPTHKSAVKRLRTSKKANIANKQIRTQVKGLIKKTETSPEETSFRKTASAVDSAARSGVIHPNKAARIKSRLSKLVQKKEPAAGQ